MSFFGGRRQTESAAQPEIIEAEEADENPQDKPQKPLSPPSFDTILGKNTEFEGTITSDANIRLDGKFTGKLNITGNVLVGDTAEIHANIEARNVTVAGLVRGDLGGKRVHLLKTAQVWGDVKAVKLIAEEGAFLQGTVRMTEQEALPSGTPPADADATQPYRNFTPLEDENRPGGRP